jgi:hypothetical protein
MRFILFIIFIFTVFSACNKDKFTTAPQISFKEFEPNQGSNRDVITNQPHLIFEITDGDGDLDRDSAKIFLKNTLTGKVDSSLRFPELGSAAGKNFKGDVRVGLFSVMQGRNLPSTQRPFVDTLSFEVFVVDKAKNKSNVIIAQPFYFFTL